jgi:hypothetical protein
LSCFIFIFRYSYFQIILSGIRYVLNPSGIGQRFRWTDHTQSWDLLSTSQADQCENYATCGTYTSCNINRSPVCECLKGFIPKSPKSWNSADWSDGCLRGTPLGCNDGSDGFLTYKGVKLPDTSSSRYDRKMMSLKECKEWCLKNCSCTAYANLDIRNGGSGCLLWFAELVDIVEVAVGGQDLYVRVPASVVGILFALLLLLPIWICVLRTLVQQNHILYTIL